MKHEPADSRTTLPATRDELLIAALRHANATSGTLNLLRGEVSRLLGDEEDDPKYDRLHDLLRLSLCEESGVPLFIAANNIGIALPPDLRGCVEDEGDGQ